MDEKEIHEDSTSADRGSIFSEKLTKHLSLAVMQSGEGVAVTDPEGNLMFVNSAFARMHGYSPGDLLGKNLSIFHTPEQLPSVEQANTVLRETGEFKGEIWHVRRDGHVFPTLMNNSLVRDDNGNVIGMMGTLRDISDLKTKETELKESEEKYLKLVQSALDGIIIVKGIEIKFVNNAALDMFGFRNASEMIGRPMTDFISAVDRDVMIRRGKDREKGQDVPSRYEFEALRKDGTQFLAEISVALIMYGGEVARQGIIRDITAHKQIEKELQKSHANLKTLLENTNDHILLSDKEGKPIIWNAAYEKVMKEALGIDMEPGLKPHTLLPDKDAVDLWEDAHGRVLGGEKFMMEYAHTFGGEDVRHFEISFQPILENGEVKGFSEITRDISKRKQVEKVLRESEERYRLIAENVADVIWTMDMDLNTTYISPSIYQLRAYTPEEVMNQTLEDMVLPQSFEKVTELLADKLTLVEAGNEHGFEPVEFEVMQPCKDGSVIWTSNKARVLPGPDNKAVGILGVTREITDNKKAEEALKGSELKHKTLVKNIPGMVYRAYPDWSAEVISGCEGISGYTVDELNSKENNWLSIIHPDDRDEVFKQGSRLVENPRDLVQTYRIITKNGDTRWVEDRKTSLFSKDQEFMGLDGIVFDITGRKKAEKALRAARTDLKRKVKERTKELATANKALRAALQELEVHKKELEDKSDNLTEVNAALNVLLKKREQDEIQFQERIAININQLISPYLDKIRRSNLDGVQRALIDILQSNLKEITTPFTYKLSSKYFGLTPTEIKVADLVRHGHKNKEIADILGLSYKTVESHREKIRDKLGIKNTKANLRSHLLSID